MKHALKSKTILGILIAAAGHFGVTSEIVADPATASAVDQWLAILGYVLALYGRWKAGGLSLMPTETPAPPA